MTRTLRSRRVRGLLRTFRLSEASGSHRTFCATCGSPVFNDHPTIKMTDVPAVSIPDLVFDPELHSHYPERVLRIFAGLPKYKDFDPRVGGTGEVVPE